MIEHVRTRAARPLPWAALAGALMLVPLAGCSGAAGVQDELYASARQANLLFKEAVATVQLHLYDGDWQVQEYGDTPVDCDGGYSFEMGRTTPEGWTLEAGAMDTAHHLSLWLSDRGWTTTDATVSDDGDVRVEASDPALAITSLVVEVRDGEAAADAIAVHASTECFDGDARELTAMLYPGWPDHPKPHDPLPPSEPAAVVPIFGFGADGHPR